MSRFLCGGILLVFLVACVPASAMDRPSSLSPSVPNFEHIVIIVFENEAYDTIIGNPQMPYFNELARDYTLLTNYYAIGHPSLPNYLALIGGNTFGIDTDCTECFVDAPNLPELIEASGRTWRTYQEDMPQPCYMGDQGEYFQKHNPFLYFDSIRLNQDTCAQSVVPLSALSEDIRAGTLPNFIFITPDICSDSHSCPVDVADAWLADAMSTLTPALDQKGSPYLIAITFDEAPNQHGFRRLLERGGGRVPVILYSPDVRRGFEDNTRYSHYSLLKTISAAWGLTYLGHAADTDTRLITAPWSR